jgi:hypothetical protein
MKVPTNPTVRIAILIASAAFILTFIVVLLIEPGEFLLRLSVASDFVESKPHSKPAVLVCCVEAAGFSLKTKE